MAFRYDAEKIEQRKRFYHERSMRAWLREIETYPDPGWCYFIGAPDGLIKIGYSRHPNRRLYELRRDTPEKLALLAKVNGGRGRESYYHTLFREHRASGEWFRPHPEIASEIERLSVPGKRPSFGPRG